MKKDITTIKNTIEVVEEILQHYPIRETLLDMAIILLRDNLDIVIYNAIEPFVDPKDNCILYRYKAKFCNLRDGWNGRQLIGSSDLTNDPKQAKTQIITTACEWAKNRYLNPSLHGNKCAGK